MSNQFKAIVINQTENNFTREIKSLEKSFFKIGDVLVDVDYSGLNYKDALILNDGGKLVKEYPQIPGVDFSGRVLESENANFKIGDNVISTGWRVGEIYPGGYAQLVKVKSEFLVKTPEKLTNKNAMILGTAGLTALLCSFAIKAREELLLGEKICDVLVTGATGGVGSIAVMILSKLGYKVTAVTGKKDQNDFLKKLGASNIINRKEFESEPKLLGKGLWDGVIDTVGGTILANVISQTKHSGIVAACGNAGGIKLNTTVMPFILRGIKLWGIDSISISIKRRKFLWNEMANLINFEVLEKYTKIVGLEELLNIFPNILKGEIAGRVLVDVKK
jgi:alcohol dehydrogenase/acrylyl-CoA reductase (NADPH)